MGLGKTGKRDLLTAVPKKKRGRKPGQENSRTRALRALADDALKSGRTPLEVMLENMRYFADQAQDHQTQLSEALAKIIANNPKASDVKDALEIFRSLGSARMKAQECAKDSANYVHAKLSSVTMKGDPDEPIELIHKGMTIEEAAAAWASTLKRSTR